MAPPTSVQDSARNEAASQDPSHHNADARRNDGEMKDIARTTANPPDRRTLEGQAVAHAQPVEESDQVVMAVEKVSPIRRVFRRLVASEAELEAEELQREAAASGCVMARACSRGQIANISGRLRTVVYTPRTNLPTLEAELYDGSGLVTLVWLGRRHIAGIEPGRQLTVRGRVAFRGDRKVVYNPHYELEIGNAG